MNRVELENNAQVSQKDKMLSQRKAGGKNKTEERNRSWSARADKGLGEGAARQERERGMEGCRRQRGQRAGWAAGGG